MGVTPQPRRITEGVEAGRRYDVAGCRCDAWNYEAHTDPGCPLNTDVAALDWERIDHERRRRRLALFVIAIVWGVLLGATIIAWSACVHAQAFAHETRGGGWNGYGTDAILWGLLGLTGAVLLIIPIGYALRWAAVQLRWIKGES